jgi:CNT family concentrative nucleoside transporter
MDILRGFTGMIFLIAVAYVLSSHRNRIDWKLVLSGILIQFVFAVGVLKIDVIKKVFEFISRFFVIVLDFSKSGADFVFGGLVSDTETFGFIFAFQVLPTVIFFSALSSFLYYLGILQRIVYVFAWVMSKTMRLSGAESLATASNIFIGQTEAPLIIKPYLSDMTKSEILTLMCGGMATIAGGVFAAYVGFLGGTDPVQRQFYATHLLTASILSAPAAIVFSKILYPEIEPEKINTQLFIPKEKVGSNILDAVSNGTSEGLKLAVNVAAMLIAFTAFMYMFNYICKEWIGSWTGLNKLVIMHFGNMYDGFSLQFILGMIFSPLAWVLGVSANDMLLVGQLLGEKTILNEFFAYTTLGKLKSSHILINQKSIIIATYALCGFSNFASIGIQIGGIGSLAPNQRQTLSEFGIKALIGGSFACFMTAIIAGMLI